MNRNTSIIELKGIGEKTAKMFNKVGIFTYGDLIYYFPKDYIFFEAAVEFTLEKCDKLCSFSGRLVNSPVSGRKGRMTIVTANVLSGDILISATWFNMPYIANTLKNLKQFVFRGKVMRKGNRFCIDQPILYTCEKYETIKDSMQPVYPLTKGLTNNALTKAIKTCLEEIEITNVTETWSVNEMHFPKNLTKLKEARRFLVYDEFFMFMLKLRFLRKDNECAANDFKIDKFSYSNRLIEELPYELTQGQKAVYAEICTGMQNNHSMSRLIQGDVGCGKTIIAILACIIAGENGYQSALMAPTEILAAQHYENIKKLFGEHNIPLSVAFLSGSMTKKQKDAEYERIRSGEADIVVGTHAIIQEKVKFSRLALVITDEQHRFGVKQRRIFAEKNSENTPHILVMSATPIPRTLAIMMYGDLDISVIKEVPKQRLPIKNCVVPKTYRKKAYEFIEKEVAMSHQAYVICPLVEASDGLELEDVVSYTEKLRLSLTESIVVEYLHGKMSSAEKDRIMSDFSTGKIDVLVSTTVVEVGVNVPNATVMLVENAERFGLAQLHQLRGRIGRGAAQSYCIFVNGNENEHTNDRLDILNKSNDGFKIASEDLRLRGPGDIFGIRQSGELSFRLGDIYNDAEILKEASDNVSNLLLDDPDISKAEHREIKEKLAQMLKDSNIKAL